jgi:hypothetical protein
VSHSGNAPATIEADVPALIDELPVLPRAPRRGGSPSPREASCASRRRPHHRVVNGFRTLGVDAELPDGFVIDGHRRHGGTVDAAARSPPGHGVHTS